MRSLHCLCIGLYALAAPCFTLSAVAVILHVFGSDFLSYRISQLLDSDGTYPIGGLVGGFAVFVNVIVITTLFCFKVNPKAIPAIVYPVNFLAIQLAILALVTDIVYLVKTGTNIIREQLQTYSDRDRPVSGEFDYAIAVVSMTACATFLLLLMVITLTISGCFLKRCIKKNNEDLDNLESEDLPNQPRKGLFIQRIHLIAFCVAGSFMAVCSMIISYYVSHYDSYYDSYTLPSVGIVWFIPVWFLSIMLCLDIDHPIWTSISLPIFFATSAVSAVFSIIGFGYELASLITADDFHTDDFMNDLVLFVVYTAASCMMLIDLLAVTVLTVICK